MIFFMTVNNNQRRELNQHLSHYQILGKFIKKFPICVQSTADDEKNTFEKLFYCLLTI